MKRLLSLAIVMVAVAMSVLADTQADFTGYIKAYNSQIAARQYLPAAKSAAGACMACADAKNYDGAFKLLSGFDKILADRHISPDSMPAPYYYTAKTRYELYQRLKNHASAETWLKKMGDYAKLAKNKDITTDMLFTEAQFYYTTGNVSMGDRCIARLIKQYDSSKDYKQADKAYRELIDRAVAANDAVLVEHTYESYMHWSDSIEAANADTELVKVKKEMADTVEEMEKMDHTIHARTGTMVTFISLFV